ncbi:hypothetical protein [Pseudonocardia abyssalis]|uniref:DUF4386 family protein n=1 Tax=Pseudonocardia abyssalis TaxID=2792008 RepID=A0ABS6UNQ5_9PSEU|nr:hypothetical protein [Pseudonocardia abyssalis]MBW0116037.1 hypothetical protein [Pseudonocardia abyssalis]MBW0133883.1 hypothetical protein [Pseudonocardia abyssalis]
MNDLDTTRQAGNQAGGHIVPADPLRSLGPADRRLLRGAGLTGTVGSLLMLATFVFVGALGLPDPSAPETLLRFPEIQYARAAEHLLYLAALVLWAVHLELLHRVLRVTAPVLSTAARTVGSLGSAVLTANAVLNIATAPMSRAYQQAAEVDRPVVVLAWQAAQGVMDALLVTGALLLPVAVVLFGIALCRGLSPVLGRGAVVVGTAGTAAVVVVIATSSPSTLVAVSILGTLTFHLAAGIRWIRLSRR